MATYSRTFSLRKTQCELDFVDVPVDADIPLFIDPFAISQRRDPWSGECHDILTSFFQRVVDAIRRGQDQTALELLHHLREPNETRFGYSQRRPRGAGIGRNQAQQLFGALQKSAAVRTGFISSLAECELMIEGVDRDKISDITTNVLRAKLAEYTQEQCNLFGIPMGQYPLPPCYDPETGLWASRYLQLPLAGGQPVLLVPKAIARFDPAYNAGKYYSSFVLNYLRAEHLNAGSSLVRTLKNGRRTVHKNDLRRNFPFSKRFLFDFSRQHPRVLDSYKQWLADLQWRHQRDVDEAADIRTLAAALHTALLNIAIGDSGASDYHSLMIGALEFLLFPSLLYPKKEAEIHQGRKRIDIVMENGARRGIFADLRDLRHVPCDYVMIECKNYRRDIANPELDQISGRFSRQRGKVGIICCRQFENRALFAERCRDTFRDERGLVIPLDDTAVIALLDLAGRGEFQRVDRFIRALVTEIWIS